jgi:HD superfamily phosphohydrolase
VLSFRDPIHGFIRADPLEAALIACRPLQRLRFIHQLGFTYLVYPGAEHSRFSHVLGAMELAGRVYDRLAEQSKGLLPQGKEYEERRLVRVAALLHDVGHAPFSHSAEDLFAEGIDHEQMTWRLLLLPEVAQAFAEHGRGLTPARVIRVLQGETEGAERLLSQIISGDLDVDKMDYLLRDSLYCGVRYGHYDVDRLLDTMLPIEDPATGLWSIGVDEGGIHSLEALVLARYYMFTQVYFNVTGKVLELHLNEWLKESGRFWPAEAEAFLEEDDVSILQQLRHSPSPHARAITHRDRFALAYETREHLSQEDKEAFEAQLPALRATFGSANLLVSNSAKDPHRFHKSGVRVRFADGSLEPMETASNFIGHLSRIDRYRIYSPPHLRDAVADALRQGLDG